VCVFVLLVLDNVCGTFANVGNKCSCRCYQNLNVTLYGLLGHDLNRRLRSFYCASDLDRLISNQQPRFITA
jgi:hypothetical protein